MAKKEEKKDNNIIGVQLVDTNSSWEYKPGVRLVGAKVGKVNADDKVVKQAIKLGVIKEVKLEE